MEWFDHVILGTIRGMMRAARENYAVDPLAFIIIYLASVPFFYFSIFRMIRALARRRQQDLVVWSMVFLGAVAAPFLYVLFFGRNLPWWVYVIIALLIGQGVYSLVRRLRKKPSVEKPSAEGPSEDRRSAEKPAP